MKQLELTVAQGLGSCAVARGASLLVGISGGPDSVALLCSLCALREEWALTLTACIVDHGIRGRQEIERDIAFTSELCRARSVPLETAAVPAGECLRRARSEGRSLEEVAREARHGLLAACARKSECSAVALGHTQDDALETLLMRIIQGSDASGLVGIRAVRGPFIRPMLEVTRRDVIAYLGEISQAWREDATNTDVSILRNRVRRSLVPVLDREFTGWRSGVLALSAKAGLVAEHLDRQAGLMGWARTARGFSIPFAEFEKASAAVRAASLMTLYDRMRGPGSPRRLPWRFLAPALGTGLPPRGVILRGHGVQLSVRGGSVCLERCIVSKGKKGYFIEVSDAGSSRIPEIGVQMDVARASEKRTPEAGELILLSREIAPPLVVRSRRAGDEIILESGTTSLKELFAGWKVSERDRHSLPLLTDRKGVVAVLGAAMGYRDRVRAGARSLRGGEAERIVVRVSRNLEEGREQQQR